MKNLVYSNLKYIETGEDNEEVILFLHPKLVSNWIWRKQLSSFNNYHCFYLNLINKTIKENVEIITQLIENKILDNKEKNIKINLVGIEFGGQIAIEILNKNPKIINKIFLSGISLNEFNETKIKVNKILSKTKLNYLKNKDENFLIKAYLRYYGISKNYYEDMKKSLDSINDEELYIISNESLNYKLNNNFSEKLNRNKFNTNNILISYGTKEDLSSQISAFNLKSMLENIKLIQINNGLMLWNLNQSELFNKNLKEFLKE